MELGIFQKLATTLGAGALANYLAIDAAAMADVRGWDRKMINKQICPTKRVFLEKQIIQDGIPPLSGAERGLPRPRDTLGL